MPMAPWSDWIPGALSKKQLVKLCSEGFIRDVENPEAATGSSSIDLHLTNKVFELIEGSVKPFFQEQYFEALQNKSLLKPVTLHNGTFHLKKRKTYLVKLKESLSQNLRDKKIYGQATAKSSIGRVDVLVRMIIDGMSGYDVFEPDHMFEGDMFVEITPISFDVRIKKGIALAQLRLFYGEPRDAKVRGQTINETCLLNSDNADDLLSVTLEPHVIGGLEVSAFEGGQKSQDVILDLWKQPAGQRPKPWEFFRFLKASDERLLLKPGAFYLLRSKERLTLPSGIAVYCRAIDETLGEMRIHYAGFAHPWFGRNRGDHRGTPLIFEVRAHDVPMVLRHGEKMARLTFYRMSAEVERPDPRPYDAQELRVSNLFEDFPSELVLGKDGHVGPKGE